MRVTVHEGGFERYSVKLMSTTGQGEAETSVFAGSIEDAGPAAIEKMQDKWLRHRNKRTHWRVLDVKQD